MGWGGILMCELCARWVGWGGILICELCARGVGWGGILMCELCARGVGWGGILMCELCEVLQAVGGGAAEGLGTDGLRKRGPLAVPVGCLLADPGAWRLGCAGCWRRWPPRCSSLGRKWRTAWSPLRP